ncbi:MAG TPA: hypothetical protein VFQ38_08915 [Longimicrobiales bacterium]|nr:hypothetical protein [Longimicrobiales bacterium]
MTPPMPDAAGRLQRIAAETAGEHARRAAAGAVVLRGVQAALAGGEGVRFLAARALAEVEALGPVPEARVLLALACMVAAEPERGRVAGLAAAYAGVLEESSRYAEAGAVLELARGVAPEDAELALHAARLARKSGEPERARALYREAAALDAAGPPAGAGRIARLAQMGEALLAGQPERALSVAVREAVVSGDAHAAAVGLEERARLRRSAGNWRGAARDLAVAALRHHGRVDRARAAHLLADVAVAGGDPLAAREALLAALAVGDRPQQELARARLQGLSRDLGDRLGVRRWGGAGGASPMVSLGLRPAGRRVERSLAPVLARWRGVLENPPDAPAAREA